MLAFKTSWRRLQNMFWRHLQHVSSLTIFCLPRRLQHVFSVTIFRLRRRLQDVLKTSWRRKNCYAKDVLKTSWRHVLKTSWRRLVDKQNVYWNICIKPWPTNKSKSVFNNSFSHKSLFHQSKANPNFIN